MAVVTLGLLVYFGFQIYRYVNDPMLTTLAYAYQVEDTVEISVMNRLFFRAVNQRAFWNSCM